MANAALAIIQTLVTFLNTHLYPRNGKSLKEKSLCNPVPKANTQ